MHGKAAIAEIVQRGEFARGNRGRDKSGTMRENQTKPFGRPCGVGRDDEAVGTVTEVANQDAIEIRVLMRAGKAANIIRVEHRSLRRMNLGHRLRKNHSDEFDAHYRVSPVTTRLLRRRAGLARVTTWT